MTERGSVVDRERPLTLTLVDFGEENYTREFGVRITVYQWMRNENAWPNSVMLLVSGEAPRRTHCAFTTRCGLDIFVEFFDQHAVLLVRRCRPDWLEDLVDG